MAHPADVAASPGTPSSYTTSRGPAARRRRSRKAPVQSRLIVPDPKRVRGRRRGDVLVSLSRGLAGKRGAHISQVHRLGLTRWGDQILLESRQIAQLGALRHIAHLVTVTYLGAIVDLDDAADIDALRAMEAQFAANAGSYEDLRVSEFSGEYTAGPTHGLMQRFERDEWLHIERQSNDGVVVSWSTRHACGPFVVALGPDLPSPSETDAATWQASDIDEETMPTAELLSSPRHASWEPEILRAQFAGRVVFWREAAKKHYTSKTGHREGSIYFPPGETFERHEVELLIRATGSPVVKRFAEVEPMGLEELLIKGSKRARSQCQPKSFPAHRTHCVTFRLSPKLVVSRPPIRCHPVARLRTQ